MRLPLFVPAQRPALHELGPAPLREADVDDIEVLRNHGLRENRARLTHDLGAEVAVRQVREGQEPHAGGQRELCRARSRGVQRLLRALPLLDGERRLVHQDVGIHRCLEHGGGSTRVAGQCHLPPGPRGPEDLLGAHGASVGKLDGLAALEPPEERAFRNAEALRFLEVETARPRFLDQHVAVRRDAVLHRESLDPVVRPLHPLTRCELDEGQLVAQPAEDAPEDPEQVVEPGWAEDGQRHIAAAKGERLQHPGQTEVVVGVVVGQEDLRELDEPDRGAQELALRPLAAIDEDPFAAAADQRAGEAAPGGRHRTRGSEEDEVEVHSQSLGASALKSDGAQADFPGAVPRLSMTQRVTASVGLLWTFVLLSGVVLAGGCLILSSLLTTAVKNQALDDAKLSLTQYANGVLGPRMIYGTTLQVGDSATSIVNRDLAERPDILSVKVWNTDGTLEWANLDPDRIGHTFPLGADLREVLETREATAELSGLEEAEDAAEAARFSGDVIEVYAPLFAGQSEVVGAYEVYADAGPLEASIAERKRAIWGTSAALFALLWVLLMLLARNASGMLRRQTTALRERSAALSESYRMLEESSIEAIESLNATVEAKDPYTAGHSVRVQRIAVSIAQELGVPPKDLDAVRFGGLFHDIGKIAIPDVLLTKPARLSEDEYELMKRHASEGARIVSKFSRLRECVPIIRHHHERWDGTGYPERLAGDDIPLFATIVALAEAWDAMTIERPYQRALRVEEALVEVREHRGTQFSPTVVDAFFTAVAKRPGDFGVPDSEALVAG
jgi:putative nucleotidyltransferase with HDIG domain